MKVIFDGKNKGKMLKPKLKVSNIKDLHDARYCAAQGVSFLGFDFGRGSAKVNIPEKVNETMNWLSGPESVGEFGYAPIEEIMASAKESKLDHIELPLDYPIEFLEAEEIRKASFFFRSDPLRYSLEQALAYILKIEKLLPRVRYEIEVTSLKDQEFLIEKIVPTLSGIFVKSVNLFEAYKNINHVGAKVEGLTLGGSFFSTEGFLDYEKCDRLIEDLFNA